MVKNLKFSLKASSLRDLKWRISVGVLTAFSAFTNLWGIANVERSEYYATIPKSMSRNIGNFIFGAMDPGGIISVDKIPGSFWIPAIFVKLFGFSTWSITAPNALAAIAATLVITFVIKKYYGMTAGLIAGSILATTPIVVAVARSNQPQSIYYLAIAIAIRFSIIALNEASRKHLIWAGVWIAIAFHTYMLLAWALWPPLIIAYLVTTKSWRDKVKDLSIAGSISLATSSLWIFMVSLVPAEHRPFIGGTNTNSGLDLVLGYNGIGRFTRSHIAGGDFGSRTFTPPFGGEPSPFRLFNVFLIGQISWLLPTAIITIFLLIFLRHKSPLFIFSATYLLIQVFIFSAVQGMHQFYVSTMTFPIAIILILGIYYFGRANKPYFIIAIAMISVCWALIITIDLKSYLSLAPIAQSLALIVFLALSVLTFKKVPEITTSILFVGALVLTPALWSIDTLQRSDAYNPMAGPTFAELGIAKAQRAMNRVGGVVEKSNPRTVPWKTNIDLIDYIRTKSDAKFALATFSGLTAAPFINSTNELIYPIGGFNGEDPNPKINDFKLLIESGDIRFVLANSNKPQVPMPPPNTPNSKRKAPKFHETTNQMAIQKWVNRNCATDPYSIAGYRLLDCK